MTTEATPREFGSHAGLDLTVNRALFADECQRLAEWALIGPVQRAALESFSERLLAAERERCAMKLRVTRADVSVAAGDLSAQEWRTCSAVLRWMQARILA